MSSSSSSPPPPQPPSRPPTAAAVPIASTVPSEPVLPPPQPATSAELAHGESSRAGDAAARSSSQSPVLFKVDESLARSIFDEVDLDNDGFLQPSEVRAALHKMHLPFSSKALEQFMADVDRNKDDRVSFSEFLAFVTARHDALVTVFKQLDCGGDGTISYQDLKTACERYDLEPLSSGDIKRLIAHADGDQSGDVTFDEFARIMVFLGDLHTSRVFEHWVRHSALETGEYGPPPEPEEQVATWMLLTSGAVAGAVSRTMTAPMDRLKTLLQAQGAATDPKSRSVHVTGVVQGFKAVYQEGGWRAFWRGNGANVIKIAPETACKFWAYETLKHTISDDPDNVTMLERFVSGAAAGALAQTAIYPLEIAKTRIALSATGEYRGIGDVLFKILKYEKPVAMYRGLGASLAGIVPYSGVDLTVYSLLKDLYATRYPDDEPGITTLLCCGALSTTCGQLVAYPLQLIRTRLQAQGMYGRPVVYKNAFDCFKQTVAADGVPGLYRGILPNFMKSLPAISISYAVYETTKRWLAAD